MHSIQKFTLTTLLTISLAVYCAGNTARTCYTCNGINCMRTSESATQKCLDPLDYCVTIFEKFNVVQKGCSLEIPIERRKHCDNNTAECHKCNTDRCNSLGQINFMCLECDSSQNSNCAQNPSSITSTRCASPTAPNSYCYVAYENNVTKRGCATTVADQQKCAASANCMLCLPGDIRGCNSVAFTAGTRSMKF